MPPSTSLSHLPRRALAGRATTKNGISRQNLALAVIATSYNGVRLASTTTATPPSSSANPSSTPSSLSRSLHSTTTNPSPPTLPIDHAISLQAEHAEAVAVAAGNPLSTLSTPHVLRSLLTTTISSSPTLLPPSMAIMSFLANSTSPLLNPDRNPVLRSFLKSTFYRHFCAGENAREVDSTARRLREMGFSGVILGYAREVVLPDGANAGSLGEARSKEDMDACVAQEIIPWATGTMETVKMAREGDFVALKFSGAGKLSIAALAQRQAPPKLLRAALDSICELAVSRNIRLLFDAEQSSIQKGIDDWTVEYMRKYNTVPGKAVVYGTYQCYLKSTPATLASHLTLAQKEGWTLGAKLVRGAYMRLDPRELIWDTKDATDACYNTVAGTLLRRRWNDCVSGSGAFPDVSVVLATHNAASVRKAKEIQRQEGAKTELSIAQLQGMADEISCDLVTCKKADSANEANAFKYIVWGSTGECVKYLLRRAQENKDAVQRTTDTRNAMRHELIRRVKGMFGFA